MWVYVGSLGLRLCVAPIRWMHFQKLSDRGGSDGDLGRSYIMPSVENQIKVTKGTCGV